jgi:SAM-dependent methyltransferase
MWRYNPIGLVRLAGHHAFDIRNGVETSGYGDLRYEPTPAPVLTRTVAELRALGCELSEYLFVDVGSGKGKVLLLAARYPFSRIVGIERFEDLHAIAIRNLAEALPTKDRERVESLCMDAAKYDPPSVPTIFYLFNPFSEEILARFLERLERSLEDHPRPVYLGYYAPIVARRTPWDRRRVFDASKYLRIARSTKNLTIYTSVAENALVLP